MIFWTGQEGEDRRERERERENDCFLEIKP
jgi:hypothetical protein